MLHARSDLAYVIVPRLPAEAAENRIADPLSRGPPRRSGR